MADRDDTKRNLLIALGGVAVLALIVLVAWLSVEESNSGVADLSIEEVAGSPSVEGDVLPTYGGDPNNDPTIGQVAPSATGADFDGTPRAIGDTGTPQLVLFMAHWCSACDAELDSISPWLAAGNLPDGVELLTVATSFREGGVNWPPQRWFEDAGFTGPIIVDDEAGSLASAYGLNATPFWVALDAEGRVIGRTAGVLPNEQIAALAAQMAS